MRIKFKSMYKCLKCADILKRIPFFDVYEGNMSAYGGNANTYCITIHLAR
jgi:hypothetical protein